MNRNITPLLFSLVPTLILVVVVTDIYHSRQASVVNPLSKKMVLGASSGQAHFGDVSVVETPKPTTPQASPTAIDSPTPTVIPTVVPKHEIHVVSYPESLYVGATATFTWDVSGPAAMSGFIAIVGGTTSRPGMLDTSVSLGTTPYAVMVSDFTNGAFGIPLRFVGNSLVKDPGTYFFRALAFIDGKNIWSDEFSFVVK